MNAYRKSKTACGQVRQLAQLLRDDKITVYAAQASFFVVISLVPLLSLVISIISFFIPTDIDILFEGYTLSEELMSLVGTLLEDLRTAPKVSLLSFSAVTTLWSASKGIGAIRSGIETVYCADSPEGFLLHRLKSLVNTLVFIVLLLVTAVLLLFGDFISDRLHIIKITDLILRWRTPFLVLFMCVVFTPMYASTAKRSRSIKDTLLPHVPGAFFASVGWILFSFCYSLYIKYFPNASYIYGGLTAVCLIMLWLYFCMIILLLGAEVNKLGLARRDPHSSIL